MKKLIILGLMCLVALHTSAQEALAWGWLKRHCCCNFTTTLNIKPYNAFSPVAYGSIVGDGCMPVNVFGGCCPPQRPGGYGPGFDPGYGASFGGGGCAGGACYGPSCGAGGCFPGGIVTAPGGSIIVPGAPMPTAPVQPLTPTAYTGVMPVAYNPYQAMYNPYMNMGQQPVQAPSYWYGR